MTPSRDFTSSVVDTRSSFLEGYDKAGSTMELQLLVVSLRRRTQVSCFVDASHRPSLFPAGVTTPTSPSGESW
jgi:hypothetical protein